MQNMWGIPVSLLAKPKLIFGTYEGHTVNISQLCQSPKGKGRTNEFYTSVFLYIENKSISSPRCDSFFKKKKSTISSYICAEMFHFRDARQPQTWWHTSQNVKQEIALLGTFETSNAQQGSAVIEWSWNTRTTSNATRARSHTTSFWSTSFRRWCVSTITATSPSDMMYNTYGASKFISPTDYTNTKQKWCHNCSYVTKAVNEFTRYRRRPAYIRTEGTGSISWSLFRSVLFLVECACLQAIVL